MRFVPQKIYVQEGLQEDPTLLRARRLAPSARNFVFGELTSLLRELEGEQHSHAKRTLVIAARSGGFVKPFPGGPGTRRANWLFFVPAVGCPANCRYCFLQTYHSSGVPVIFADQSAMLAEIESFARMSPAYFYGGELCDNLMLEPYLGIVPSLLALFRRLPNSVLELRTKSDDISVLLANGPLPNVIVSWTLIPAEIAAVMEPGTAPIASRIAAARLLQDAGFRVGLRFDPIVLAGDWRRAYGRLVTTLSKNLDPALVDSVHMGCMRYPSALKTAVASVYGPGTPFCGEFVCSIDGKSRYPRPLRVAAYTVIAGLVRAWARSIPISLVMETPEVENGVQDAAPYAEA